jgi:hypothetical protein
MGPGKYDKLCTTVRDLADAQTALVIIISGNQGSGFSCQTRDPNSLFSMPTVLRKVADQIEHDQKAVG